MPATMAIIVLNAAVYLLMVVVGRVSPTSPTVDQLWRWGANYGPLTFDHQWWRLLANAFVHIGFLHLAVNMWSLWNLGALAERLYGRWLYLFIYLFSGVAGSMASLAWHPMVTSAGASGAIFGLSGALIVTFRWGNLPIPRRVLKPILSTLVVFTVANVLFGLWTQFVDNGAHLGGLAGGLLLGAIVIQPAMRGADTRIPRLLMAGFTILALAGLWGYVVRANDWVVHVDRGQRARAQKKYDDAIRELRTAEARKPNQLGLELLLARTYLEAGQVVPAKVRLLHAVEIDKRSAEAWSELGLIYLGSNQPDQAYDALSKAVALQPNSAEAVSQLAIAAVTLRRTPEAITLYKRVIVLNPGLVEAYKNLGILYLSTKDTDNALATFQQMAKIAPNSFEAQVGLATAYKLKGMETESQAALEKARKLRPPQQAQPQPPANAPTQAPATPPPAPQKK